MNVLEERLEALTALEGNNEDVVTGILGAIFSEQPPAVVQGHYDALLRAHGLAFVPALRHITVEMLCEEPLEVPLGHAVMLYHAIRPAPVGPAAVAAAGQAPPPAVAAAGQAGRRFVRAAAFPAWNLHLPTGTIWPSELSSSGGADDALNTVADIIATAFFCFAAELCFAPTFSMALNSLVIGTGSCTASSASRARSASGTLSR